MSVSTMSPENGTSSTTGGPATTGTWRDQARCRGVDPQVFHPSEEDEAAADAAKAICALCPVVDSCLEFAITAREKDGVWGGLTAPERRRLIRQRRRSA